MKTVPTLCASATVTGVSVVGYAIGTTDSPDEALSFFSPGHDAKMAVVHARSQHPDAPIGGVFDSSPYSHASTRSHFSGHRQSSTERPHSKRLRRTATAGSLGHQSLDLDRAMNSVAEDETVEAQPQLRSRPSWVKRLSAMSLVGDSASETGGSRPASASMSFSAGSTNFSRAGSTVPIFGAPQQPLPPNKLVKRSSSLRASSGLTPQEGSGRFGRPLTSHDRIKTLRARPSSSMEPLDWSSLTGLTVHGQRNQPRWRHYFTAKTATAEPEGQQPRPGKTPRTTRRLFADETAKPFLVMAKSIVTTAVEVDDAFRYSQDAESVMFGGSRPMTPAGLNASHSSPLSSAASKRSRPEPSIPVEDGRPRRSFSISDLLSRGPSSAKQRSSSFSDRFLRRKNLRVSSAPTRLMDPRQSIELQHERERPAKRRESMSQGSGPPPSSGSQTSNDFRLPLASPLSPLKPPTPTRSGPMQILAEGPSAIAEEDSTMADEQLPAVLKAPLAPRQSRHRVRHSVTHSEQASTIGGSDNETRGMSSGDDDDTDMTSDTMFDSIRTRATRSTSGAGARGPRIETIFDESPPHKSTQPSLSHFQGAQAPQTALDDIDMEARSWPESETVTTPTFRAGPAAPRLESPLRCTTPPMAPRDGHHSPVTPHFDSSPPKMDRLKIRQLEHRVRQSESDDEMWDIDDSTSDRLRDVSDFDDNGDGEDYERVATPLSMHRSSPLLVDTSSSSAAATPGGLAVDPPANNRDSVVSKSSVFDWSEPADTSTGSNTPPRPKTVHGKKPSGRRGSRAIGRRAPSGVHVRSQSVPVVPDVASARKENLSSKFGTWNAGKGPTEDWEEDFDFGDPEPPPQDSQDFDEKRIDSGFSMHIPKSIRDQQGSMQQNRKLLTDMYHYAGALKDLQRHAIRLGMLDDEHRQLFQDVDAIIALADEEADELGPGNFSPPSSPGFDADAFEEDPKAVVDRIKQKAGRSASARYSEPVLPTSSGGKLRRKSVLPPNDTIIFSPHIPGSNAVASEPGSSPSARLQETPKSYRPRKGSVVRAKLFVEQFRDKSGMTTMVETEIGGMDDKMAFDTATLSKLVPFVKEIVDKAKAAIREREALYSSPEGSPRYTEEPDFTAVFREMPADGSPSSRPRRNRASPNLDGVETELAQQLKMMTVM